MLVLFFYCSCCDGALHSFPTRRSSDLYDLSWKTCEPRGAQRVAVDAGPGTIQVYNAHLGTALLERRYQASRDRKSTRLNSSHGYISYAVFCLKKKTTALPRCAPALRNM